MMFFAYSLHSKKTKALLCGVLAFYAISHAHAASVSFIAPANTIPVGTSFQIEMHLETGNNILNTVTGTVQIPEGIRVTNVETGNSVLPLWPTPPMYEPSERQIIFTGGMPNGLPAETDSLLFKITAIAQKDGAYQFTSSSTQAYQNDGEGTVVPIMQSVVVVNASGSARPSGQVSVPSTPSPDLMSPTFISVEIGRDSELFNNAYFVTFYATDAESGIDYYEVKEGLFGSYVRANQYYVLQDQTLGTPLIIRAIDKAGNITTRIVPAEHSSLEMTYMLVILIGIILLILILVRRRHTRTA